MKKDERSDNTVHHDVWDEEDYQRMRAEIAQLPVATDQLLEVTHTARPEIADMYYLLSKGFRELLPEEDIRDDHQVNRKVNEQALDLAVFKELNRFTKGDPVAAGIATADIEKELEIIFDREKIRQQEADKLQELRDELQDKLNQLAQQLAQQAQEQDGDEGDEEGEAAGAGQGEGEEEGEGQGSGQGQGQGQQPGQGSGSPSLQDEINALKAAIEAAEKALKEGLSQDSSSIAAALAKAMGQALGEAQNERSVARSWGLDPGQLRRLPAKERLRHAAKMKNPRFQQIAERFGALRNLAFEARERTVEDIPHTVIGVTLGDDISRLMPPEYSRLNDEDQEWEWMIDFAEKRLQQYKMEGTEKIAKGGIVLLEDGSGSMSGSRELDAKGIALVLLDIAKAEDREFHLVHFGGPGQFKTISFKDRKDFTIDNVVDVAEIFFGGGTDFVTPLNEGMRLLKEEFAQTGRVQSDIILLTDGYCGLTNEWMEQFHKDLEEMEGVCWGINVASSGETRSEPMHTLTEGKVMTLNDLKENKGRELTNLLRGVQRPKKGKK